MAERKRCLWVAGDPLLIRYHDAEWGRPVRTSRSHFERMSLEVFQAGLNWRLILHKRPAFRKAFRGFDPVKVARMGDRDVERLMKDAGIVRNRLKIESTIDNARRFLALSKEHGSHTRYLDSIGSTKKAMQASLRRNFRFMGPLVAEAYLQSVGLIPAPHQRGCFMKTRRPPGR